MSFLSYRTGAKNKKKQTTSKKNELSNENNADDYRQCVSRLHLESLVDLLGDVSISTKTVQPATETTSKEKWPSFLYAKKANRGSKSEAFLGLLGRQTPPIVFAVEDDAPDWDVCLVMDWKDTTRVLDERRSKHHADLVKVGKNYDALVRNVGVPPTRTVWRLFDRSIVKAVRLLSPNRHIEAKKKWIPVDIPSDDPDFVIWEMGVDKKPHQVHFVLTPECKDNACSLRVNDSLRNMFGEFYDLYYDVIDVESCARKLCEKPVQLCDKIINTFSQCEVFNVSGCWLSPQTHTYRKVAIWKYAGFRPVHLFSHNGQNIERHVVRHHPTRCELFISDGNHSRCCRPSHLCYGSCKANSRDMELRRAVSTFLSMVKNDESKCTTWKDVQQHVDGLAKMLRIT